PERKRAAGPLGRRGSLVAAGPSGPGGQTRPEVQLPVPPTVLLTLVKVLLALLPRAVIAAMQTTTIRASMTAYSTAVGPLSSFRNLTRALPSFFIFRVLFEASGECARTTLPGRVRPE